MPTVTRVLPWRRETASSDQEIEPLLEPFRGRQARTQAALITRAYEIASNAHRGQMRKSGEPYIHHPLAVARIVAEQTEDHETIAAALLHDAVEDTSITLEELSAEFPEDVVRIIDGVTKLDRALFANKEDQQAATMRKLIVAVARDLRVLIIKLSDRLHNMRTIAGMPEEKQARIARETLDVYAPLAHRLGMQEIKQQLEDLAFASLYPKRYAEIDHMVATRSPERELFITQVVEEVRNRLSELHIDAEVTGRPKHLWSIYEKMVIKRREFEEIFDLVGMRVTVATVRDCYAALGSIHSQWRPVQGRFKDFIAMPKFNNYQALHTTVIGPGGKAVEVQIRTHEMDLRAEYGVASHWMYKAKEHDLEWLNRIVDWQNDFSDPGEFMANLKSDLDQEEVTVFTPKGEMVNLADGATAVDLAYHIHTEIGHSAIGARADGRLISLDSELTSGSTVEIFTSKAREAAPSREWLDVVVTPKARSKIRQWFSREDREDAIENGRAELERALRIEGLPASQVMSTEVIAKVTEDLTFTDVDSLFQAIAEGHLGTRAVAARARREMRTGDQETTQLPTTALDPRRHNERTNNTGVHVEGLDNVLVRLARCCTPVPPDSIIGFHTRGRGVSVHRGDCANAVSLASAQTDRLVEVEWDNDHTGGFVASVDVQAIDRPGLLRDVTSVLADHHINILNATMSSGADRIAKMRFDFELSDPSHLSSVLAFVRGIESVFDVARA